MENSNKIVSTINDRLLDLIKNIKLSKSFGTGIDGLDLISEDHLCTALMGALQGCPGSKPWSYLRTGLIVHVEPCTALVGGKNYSWPAIIKGLRRQIHTFLCQVDVKAREDFKRYYTRWQKTGYDPRMFTIAFQGCIPTTDQQRLLILNHPILLPPNERKIPF